MARVSVTRRAKEAGIKVERAEGDTPVEDPPPRNTGIVAHAYRDVETLGEARWAELAAESDDPLFVTAGSGMSVDGELLGSFSETTGRSVVVIHDDEVAG